MSFLRNLYLLVTLLFSGATAVHATEVELPLPEYEACFEKNKAGMFGDNPKAMLETGLNIPYLAKYANADNPNEADAKAKLHKMLSKKENGRIIPESVVVDGSICIRKNRVCGRLEIANGIFKGNYNFVVSFGPAQKVAAGDCRANEIAIIDAILDVTVYSLRDKLRFWYEEEALAEAKDIAGGD